MPTAATLATSVRSVTKAGENAMASMPFGPASVDCGPSS